jgi:hypothetical protein
MLSLIQRRKRRSLHVFGLSLTICFRPKIQRLVTPVRLQRRRHVRAIKRHRIERQKEQKTEYEYAKFQGHALFTDNFLVFYSPSALPTKKPRSPPSRHLIRRLLPDYPCKWILQPLLSYCLGLTSSCFSGTAVRGSGRHGL